MKDGVLLHGVSGFLAGSTDTQCCVNCAAYLRQLGLFYAAVLSPDKQRNTFTVTIFLNSDMETPCSENWSQFYTATIHEWKPLLQDTACKEIIVESLQFMVKEKRIALYAFVIMNNHIHLIWQPLAGYSLYDIQASFMKYTGQQLKRPLIKTGNTMLEEFKANRSDREYQIWKRESLSVELFTPAVFNQKLEYIHNNPVKAGLCRYPEEYHYSSAGFYFNGKDAFGMLTHSSGN